MTHLGPSQNCGHYTALGQAPGGQYCQFDDSSVRALPLSAVLATNAYIMFFEKDAGDDAPHAAQPSPHAAASSSAVYGPQLPDSILNRDKSPLKLSFRSDERKPTSTEPLKLEPKPIILNSTLSKSSESSSSNTEPWVLKQNGEVEKVSQPKILNGIDKSSRLDDDKKISFVIKRPSSEENGPKKLGSEQRSMPSISIKSPEKTSKLVKQSKSPLEKLEEQMNKNDFSNHIQRNGGTRSKLVPYDSESSGDERDRISEDRGKKEGKDDARKPRPSHAVATKATHLVWTVSSESSGPLLSPSLNGVTNKK